MERVDVTSRRVIGLDLSLRSTGICVIEPGAKYYAGVGPVEIFCESLQFDLKVATTEERIKRLIWLAGKISSHISSHDLKEVWMEGYAHSVRFSQNVMGELHGALKVQLYLKFGIVPTIVQPRVAMKFFTGHVPPGGKKKGPYKDAVLKRINQMTGLSLKNHDEMDALLLALYSLSDNRMKGIFSDQVRCAL